LLLLLLLGGRVLPLLQPRRLHRIPIATITQRCDHIPILQ